MSYSKTGPSPVPTTAPGSLYEEYVYDISWAGNATYAGSSTSVPITINTAG
ncbi:MAG TPA: hypothetical protein VHN18_20670 [Micromonosporaceae bacterium]|nr:hypothetical protein [Micromonosporaceae bacterium]